MLTLIIGDLIDIGCGVFFGVIATKASEPFFKGVKQFGLKHYVRSWFSEDKKRSNLPYTDSIKAKTYSNQILTLDNKKRKERA